MNNIRTTPIHLTSPVHPNHRPVNVNQTVSQTLRIVLSLHFRVVQSLLNCVSEQHPKTNRMFANCLKKFAQRSLTAVSRSIEIVHFKLGQNRFNNQNELE